MNFRPESITQPEKLDFSQPTMEFVPELPVDDGKNFLEYFDEKQFLGQFLDLENCETCYPQPGYFVFPKPKRNPFPMPRPTTNILSLKDGFWPADSVAKWQIELANAVTPDQICEAIRAGMFSARGLACEQGRSSVNNDFVVEVTNEFGNVPTFLVHFAGRADQLANFTNGFESHRYFIAFTFDFSFNMQGMSFNFEPMFNRSDNLNGVLNSTKDNTHPFPVAQNEKIRVLTARVVNAVLQALEGNIEE